MKYKKRLLEAKLIQLGKHFPVIVLTGARQVGKSTLLKHLLPEARHITFDPVIDIGNARQDPELFLNHLKHPVILDEIQYAPELLSVIKRRVDENKMPGQYWLTGSQNFSVLKNVSESLAGRAVILSLFPMTLSELHDQPTAWIVDFLNHPKDFLQQQYARYSDGSLFEVIWRGGYPGLMDVADDLRQTALDSYLHTYIERDVRLLSEVNDLQNFSRFVQLLANLTAQEIQFSHLGREIGISPQTAQRWINLMTSTFQWMEIPPFSGNTIKRISGKKKGYFIDTSLVCHLMHITTPLALPGHPKLGALFETYVVNDLLRQLSLLSGRPAIYHWRSHGGAEVDLVLELNGQYFLFEVKCKSRPTVSDTRGMKAFRETYPHLPVVAGIVISAADEILPLGGGNYAVPFDLISKPRNQSLNSM